MDNMGETVSGRNTRLSDASDGGGFDERGTPGFMEQAVWATEDDYVAWDLGGSSFETHSSKPPGKRLRSSHGGDAHVMVPNRSKEMGEIFFKTKLCCKFRAGVFPYISNCNFAHGMEELRMPPPNWQEIVASHETEVGGVAGVEAPLLPPREEHQIPIMSSPDLRGENQRSYKGRNCKKFYTDEGCPYGDTCSFLHDEQSRARESVAISVTPNVGGIGNSPTAPALKHSNWKTRICNKWEMTGYCPFGTKCHFAHGVDELHKLRGGGPVEGGEGKDPSNLSHGVGFAKATENMAAPTTSASCGDAYHSGSGSAPMNRPLSCMPQRIGEMAFHKWKGPDKISKVYGDWIDDIE